MGFHVCIPFIGDHVVLTNIFRNYKPTESDMEEDEEDDPDHCDVDPDDWFEDDQDDGRKYQDIVEPDAEDLSHIIQVDYSRIPDYTVHQACGEGT
jgi:hypothetical protein